MDIPLATGFGSYVDNVGEVKNTGFETSLSGYVIRDTERKLIWLVSGKLVYNKNKFLNARFFIKRTNLWKKNDNPTKISRFIY